MPVTSYGAAVPGGAAGGYSGGTGNWGSGTVSSTGGGGGGGNYSSGTSSYTAPKPKDQVFECIGRGLKPDTVHKFYYENVDRTKDCRQLGTNNRSTSDDGRLGGPLKTDANGYVRFYFYFTAAVEKEVDALNKVRYNLIGDKVFELRAVDSTAKKVVPFSLNTRR
jgi:hypothetical protein